MAVNEYRNQIGGAFATEDLVGRQDVLAHFEKTLEKSTGQPRIIFYWAKGGMGKTRLLDKTLQLARRKKGMRVAKNLVDFYHVNTHTSNGLADALYEVLTPPSNEFGEYLKKRQALEINLARGDVSKLTEQQRVDALTAFNEGVKVVTAEVPLVIALDTAEKAMYGLFEDKIETAEGWKWFCESFPHWGNVTILIAGREESKTLFEDIKKMITPENKMIKPENIEMAEVKPFSEAESLQYFDEVQKVAAIAHPETAERIEKLPEIIRKLAHVYSGGLPILLSLLVENLSEDRSIPGVLQGSLEEAEKKPVEELKKIRDQFEEELIEDLQTTHQIGDTIIAIGRAPKGVDENLLSLLLGGTSIEDARARLKKVEVLSFVKKRPSDDRIFLHDEMYAILNRLVYNKPEDALKNEKAERAILDYYHKYRLEKNRNETNELFDPIEKGQKNTVDLKQLIDINSERIAALTDLVYYRLRQDPVKGYKRFYRYAREATLSGNVLLELHLQSELASYLAERKTPGIPEAGMSPDLFNWSIFLRPVTRAWSSQQFAHVLEEAESIRKNHAQTLQNTSPGSEAVLSTWEAYALIFQQNFNLARQKLDHAVEIVEQALSDPAITEIANWRLSAVLGFAHRVRGYLFRVRGLMGNAINDYRQAAALFRKINLRIELATTLNDMGFAMSEQGNSNDAQAIIEDALEIRRYLGPRVPVGQSYSTLARLDLLEGRYEDAIRHAISALSLFVALGDERHAGMAYSGLAEAQRRFSDQLIEPEDKIRWLRDARDSARLAYEIFVKVDEKYRQVDALIEEGCTYRDWIKTRKDRPSGRDDIDRLAEESEYALRKAADLAGSEVLYRKIDALVNLAWLHYYMNRDELMNATANEVFQLIRNEYLIDTKTGEPSIAREAAQVQIWSQIGKLYILHGHNFFRKYYYDSAMTASSQRDREKREHELGLAAENYCIGLQYSSIFSQDYYALRIVKKQIYEKLRRLRDDELYIVGNRVEEINSEYHFKHCVMEDFLKSRALWYGK